MAAKLDCQLLPSRNLLVMFALLIVIAPATADEPNSARPRLAVLVYFDQMRGDYLERWGPLFADDGFRRLTKNGAWFRACHYPYAYTVTAAGHASVATGCPPVEHGIVGNDWFDREAGTTVNCVAPKVSGRYRLVLTASTEKGDVRNGRAATPEKLVKATIADAVKDATNGKGKVVALSLKDRSAVLPGGRRPDACYWMDSLTGRFVTSSYYRDRPHEWVDSFNKAELADQWMGKTWDRLRTDIDYEKHSGPDDVQGEGKGIFQGRTFPHPLSAGSLKLKSSYYGALYNSPYGNDLLLALAKRAIEVEQLGKHDAPDLLTLSFSSNDAIGHCWGPDSQEVLDVTLRSDRIVAELLKFLDTQIGKDKYVLVMTADHGVCPLPEVSTAQGKDAARVRPDILGKKAEEFLNETYVSKVADEENPTWIQASLEPWIYLDQGAIRRRGLKLEEVENQLAKWLLKQPGVERTYTRDQLLAGIPEKDGIGRMVGRSFYADRSGDLFVILKPFHLLSGLLSTGTTHGTPHPYDLHVPFLVYGLNIKSGERNDRISPLAAAAILATGLGIAPPNQSSESVPKELIKDFDR